jgi:hypothetical protein
MRSPRFGAWHPNCATSVEIFGPAHPKVPTNVEHALPSARCSVHAVHHDGRATRGGFRMPDPQTACSSSRVSSSMSASRNSW